MDHGNEPRDELQKAIEDSMRRMFSAPTGVGARVLARARGGPARSIGGGRTSAYAVAASVLLGLGLWAIGGGGDRPAGLAGAGTELARGDSPAPAAGPARPATPVLEPPVLGPPVLGPPVLGQMGSPGGAGPDLDALYDRFVGGAFTTFPAACMPLEGRLELQTVTLEERLAQSYDTCLDVDTPDTCALLGPFPVPEWPSATVVVAWCATDAAPTMLVVDDQSGVGCGFSPRQGVLPTFHKDVGSLAVWEVSKRGTPRLLDGIRACSTSD